MYFLITTPTQNISSWEPINRTSRGKVQEDQSDLKQLITPKGKTIHKAAQSAQQISKFFRNSLKTVAYPRDWDLTGAARTEEPHARLCKSGEARASNTHGRAERAQKQTAASAQSRKNEFGRRSESEQQRHDLNGSDVRCESHAPRKRAQRDAGACLHVDGSARRAEQEHIVRAGRLPIREHHDD